jgi:hydroxyethylthiazole kinase
MITRSPAVVRLNGAEFTTLAAKAPSPDACRAYACDLSLVVALTGTEDLVADATRHVAISNGDPLMAKVTAMGCAASALVAACLAVETDRWLAAVAGLSAIGIAGEIAAARAAGPGSLAIGVIDALHALDQAHILQRARIS